MIATPRLQRSLWLAQACLSGPEAIATRAFDFDLPPLLNGADGVMPRAQALNALAALYLHAELEQTGLILAAEALARARADLALRTEQAATRLERFAIQQRDWYDRERRLRLFARLFGLGPAGDDVNHEFQQLLGRLCQAIGRTAEEYRWGPPPRAAAEATLRLAVHALLLNLGARQYGDTLLAGRKIQAQTRAALDILGDADVGALVGGRGVWDTLRRLLGEQTPDLGRLLGRGQSGQRLLTWLALSLEAITAEQAGAPLLPPGSPVFVWAATWLEATGLAARPTPQG